MKKDVDFREGPAGTGESPHKAIDQVHLLPEPMQQAVRELIVHGATLEGVAHGLNNREEWSQAREGAAPAPADPTRYSISIDAVRQFYNADPQLQRDRAQYLVDTTEAIARSLGQDGDLDEGASRYARAVIMAGLQKVNESDSSLSLKDALRHQSERENLQLKNRMMKLRVEEAERRMIFVRAQTGLMGAKKRFVMGQTEKLHDLMRKLEKKKNITPRTLQKIQEIYGILAENVAQTDAQVSQEALQVIAGSGLGSNNEGLEHEEYYFAREDQVEDPQEQVKKRLEEQNRLTEGEGSGTSE